MSCVGVYSEHKKYFFIKYMSVIYPVIAQDLLVYMKLEQKKRNFD